MINDDFTRKLQSRFPSNTSGTQLVDTLKSDGFKVYTNDQGKLSAELEIGSLMCTQSYLVHWEKDAEGMVKGLTGLYSWACL